MKTVLKLHIVFIIMLSGYVLANQFNRELAENESNGKTSNVKQVYSNLIDGTNQSTINSQTKTYVSFYNAPEYYGGFQYYYSAQFILPDIRAGQSFGIQLKI